MGLQNTSKRLGRKNRYPVGTIVPIDTGDCIYYLLALTYFESETMRANCSVQDYCEAVLKLFEYYNIYGQQYDITVPLLGAGLARLGHGEEEILQGMLALIKLGFNYGQGNIKIVLHPELKEKISLEKVR